MTAQATTRTRRTRTARALVGALAGGLLLALPANALAKPPRAHDDTCFGQTPTITAKAPGEAITGTSGDDVILGGGYVVGGEGDDRICGAGYVLAGPGDDHIMVVNGGTAYGEDGDDEIVSIVTAEAATPATLDGGPGDDTVYGGPMGETIVGGPGNDIIRGGGGRDVLKLGPGDDKGYGGPGRDRILGGPGNDYLDGGGGKDRANGGPGLDRCYGAEKVKSCLPVSTPLRWRDALPTWGD